MRSGFSLVELLVVIAIIAILSGAAVMIFTSALPRARDSQRRSDIDAIAKAIESSTYESITGTYAATTASPSASWFAGGRMPRQSDGNNYTIVWMSAAGSPVAAGVGVTAAKWRVCAQLETGSGNAADANGTPAAGNNGLYHCGYSAQ